jgi:pilus assembly protein Flp/PilA
MPEINMFVELIRFRVQTLRDRMASDEGASAVEYGLLVSLIAAAIVALVSTLGGKVYSAFDKVITWSTRPRTFQAPRAECHPHPARQYEQLAQETARRRKFTETVLDTIEMTIRPPGDHVINVSANARRLIDDEGNLMGAVVAMNNVRSDRIIVGSSSGPTRR